ncbi:unnamed protein product [Phytophthora fragariaefolia]|uniref:Unnamed protein product n=1 Tax=Phytophthora fragariaefolia TaxID=1490495 RepID=A0A9W6XVF8_9STRA|nr:unnamed protein product [Phytophthora fragariaefolia]
MAPVEEQIVKKSSRSCSGQPNEVKNRVADRGAVCQVSLHKIRKRLQEDRGVPWGTFLQHCANRGDIKRWSSRTSAFDDQGFISLSTVFQQIKSYFQASNPFNHAVLKVTPSVMAFGVFMSALDFPGPILADADPVSDHAYHFLARKNWTSDPCVPYYDDATGLYHIFYQSNLNSTIWGNITWGHAVKRTRSPGRTTQTPFCLFKTSETPVVYNAPPKQVRASGSVTFETVQVLDGT